uniref:Upstream activation factor subunit spp27 n=1 Tax=Bombyx mori TaxID=7091 RepID=A0A8R2R439_BOMMO|nr:upstream activation factor subunit spp27 isoform X2 [Bombyx mori]
MKNLKRRSKVKILKNAELSNTSTKKVIKKLEENLGVDLYSRKKQIDDMVMAYVNSMESDDEDELVMDEKKRDTEEEEDEKEPEEEEKSADDSDDDNWGKPTRKKRKVEEKKKKGTAKPKKEKKKSGGTGKGSGYTRAYKLSPALSELMGAEEMPRHEVVKRMWALIKERNLYDPNNKRFVICDKDMHKVIGIQRFRAFGMMKYLKTHFLD